MSDFRFANPEWAHAVWLVLGLVAVLFWLDGRGRAVLDRFLAPAMQERLVRRLSRQRRWSSILLLGLSLVLLIGALMRPQWGLTYLKTPRVGAQIMVCLDVSKSMLAEDTAPNRLERAKAELMDLLSYLDGDQVGLIAFAGRAAVLCPMTTDYGFFKLVLDNAGPGSVGRGGTRLEAPVRKAIEGFGTETDVSRAILLMTDGEDHDSYPLKAAEEAAERGIKIITIGFGDEAGSEIQYTDPVTGARTVVKNADGQPVQSRLDGETLRQIALATQGAYVPAGTGALDLESIYHAHIAPLTRGQLDQNGHAVRREGFQWAVLLSFLCLVASLVMVSGSVSEGHDISEITQRRPRSTKHLSETSRLTGVVLLAAVVALGNPTSTTVFGQVHDIDSTNAPTDEQTSTKTDESIPSDTGTETRETPPAKQEEPADPRKAYNEGIACLDADPDRADRLLTLARREAGTDGEVRFRATFNMGWLEVKRADGVLNDDPAQALQHLRAAADWFRDAVRLRPEHADARYNLEVLLRRIMELADSLRQEQQRNVEQRLDELIESQRNVVGQSSNIVQQLAASTDPNAPDQFRSDFRGVAVEQRKHISEAQALGKSIHEEVESLKAKADDKQNVESQLRTAQLSNAAHHLTQAMQRMGQARTQMRRRQGERAFRRAAAALDDLKRARDQMRNPVEVLGVILADATQTAGLTAALASRGGLQAPKPETQPSLPAWLTSEYLEESQTAIADRVEELSTRLQAGLKHHEESPDGASSKQPEGSDPQAQRFVEAVRQAAPFVQQGATASAAARDALAAEKLVDASQKQFESIAALREAHERFLDLRGLIELTHKQESQIKALVASTDADDAPPPHEIAPIAVEVQKKNIERAERLAQMIDEELAALPEPQKTKEAEKPDGSNQSPEKKEQDHQAAAQRQRLQLAKSLLDQARNAMTTATSELTKVPEAKEPEPKQEPKAKQAAPKSEETAPSKEDESDTAKKSSDKSPPPKETKFQKVRENVDVAVELLAELRRLFFSLVEHLRETAQRQSGLNDDTQRTATVSESDDVAAELAPLAQRQTELATISGEIAKALREQAGQSLEGHDGLPSDQKQKEQLQQQMQQIAEQLHKAGRLVADGELAMRQATTDMKADQPDVASVRKNQDEALQKLMEALALLVPPEQQQQNQQQNQDQSQDQKDQQKQEEKQDAKDGGNLARLLQAVRDREAQRQKDKSRQRRDYEPVEKDW